MLATFYLTSVHYYNTQPYLRSRPMPFWTTNLSHDAMLNYNATEEEVGGPTCDLALMNQPDIHQLSYSISGCNGRLGNQLGVMALGFGLYQQFKVNLLLNPGQLSELEKVFEMSVCKGHGGNPSTFCAVYPAPDCQFLERPTIAPSTDDIFKFGLQAFGNNQSSLIGKRVNLPMYPEFLPMLQDYLPQFRSILPFKPKVLSAAKKLFKSMKAAAPAHFCTTTATSDGSNCPTMISVHLRMGDYSNHLRALYKIKDFTQTNYLQRALEYMLKKYGELAGYLTTR